ncbi:MAG: nickel pincer cofactor biosynthesis protein LarB [Lentisphaerae bacterium]|jgi:pyridinium-3,5-biscarboxylic acid mononucleotide synthase|nr:nickel pincer cofactor biosynthesis protein LarB [Lentisphaerota bacterium]MBT4815317.1 nickel pincer cofactor biosynthesis protein LarB [Lentisphaerota bacterium]MBT5605038.1 nickel pincer cofactor biosynthesis protein LarB [Lentisphaerota bacterium]MBT7058660.1 nickel pincer cofactor biosynthesis protein LarB [Lentisphaerota bacterium]MBT7847001.1 nickel pincer cofactor biosynthesis protein LarB [Lentisphaerota bacterium]
MSLLSSRASLSGRGNRRTISKGRTDMLRPTEPTNHVVPDTDRERRVGFAEVIYCPGKTDDQLRDVGKTLFANHENVLATRATPGQADALRSVAPEVLYNEPGRVAYVHRDQTITGVGTIAIISAGTTDIPVAEEAACTAEVMGNRVHRVYDVGVAGLHRVLAHRDELEDTHVVIVVAGMEGALPSVVGGLVSRPVIAVPTSVGYGTSFGGVTALLGMLNSCAPGVTVVNIDNGFGAAFAASRINHL